MKKAISLFLAIIMAVSLLCCPVWAEGTDLSAYALEGYYNKQLNNSWADGLALSDETDENGVITTTATYEGTLAKDKQIATFDAWADKQAIGSNASANTMHFGFTVADISDPVYLQYRYRNSSTFHALVTLTDSKVIAGDKVDGETFVEVSEPYTINIFMNTNTCDGYVFVNDQLIFTGDMNYAGSTQWRQVVVKTSAESTNFNLVTTEANCSVYNENISTDDVVKAYMGDDIFGEEEPVDPPVDPEPEEPEIVIPENLQGISAYALEGYSYNQIYNDWADGPVLSNETDENGVITTTATYEGTLASGKRVATLQPWADKSTIGGSAAANTMHFGLTVNEITDPVHLGFQYRNSSSYKALLSLSDSKVAVGDSLDAETYVEVTAPYTINMFMNIQTGYGYIFVNDQCVWENANMNPNNCTQWNQVRAFSLAESTNIKLVTTAANASLYNAEIGMDDVVKAYMGEDIFDEEEPVDPPVDPEPEEPVEPEVPVASVPEELKPLEAYTLSGFGYKQINNNWANVTLSDSTDENGIITTTATYEGTLAAGSRIASFQPWAEQGVSANAAGVYTMHFGFTVNEITSPVYLEYNYSRNGGAKKTLISLSDSKVVWGSSLDGETFATVTEPYTIDIFMNIATCEGAVYVNGELLKQGLLRNSENDKTWREVRLISLEESTDIKFVTTNANSAVYNDGVSLQDVIDTYMGKEEEPEEPGDDVTVKDESDNIFFTGIKDMSDYTLSGYNNKQINNNWADGPALSNETDENGVITTTATLEGSLDAGKRVASFQPWEKKKGTYTNAAGNYTMHFGFTVNEISDPVSLAYRFNADKKLISFSDSKVVWGGSMDGSTYIEVTAPYTIDIFMNIKTCKGIIFVNGEVLYDGTIAGNARFYNSSADTQWTEVRVTNISAATDFKLVTTAANCSIFNDSVIFDNVVDYVMNKEDAAKTNWLWQVEGLNVGRELMQGVVDGVCDITGNNTDGYVLTPNSINASHYGFARFFLGNDAGSALPSSTDDKILWQSFEYNPTKLTSGQLFEIRGNNSYQTLITAVPATETESAYLLVGGNRVEISSDKFYKIDFIVNNKDYEYYILIDGKIVAHDTIWATRQPLWNTVFSSYTVEESMTLKNVKTTVYDATVDMFDHVKDMATNVCTGVADTTYNQEQKTLTVTAKIAGKEAAFDTAEVIYAAYTKNGELVASDVAGTVYSSAINATDSESACPSGTLDISGAAEGEELTIKAFIWNNMSAMAPVSDDGQIKFNVPVTVVE